MLAKRFPFAVYCLIEDGTVDVYATLDCRRDPEWIINRLDSSRPSDERANWKWFEDKRV